MVIDLKRENQTGTPRAAAPEGRAAGQRLSTIARESGFLAQLQGFMNQAGPVGGNPNAGQRANLAEVIPQAIDPAAWEQNGGAGRMALFQPGGFGAAAGPGAGGGANARGGQGLVDLIQQVIDPESWEANGGPGIISIFGQ